MYEDVSSILTSHCSLNDSILASFCGANGLRNLLRLFSSDLPSLSGVGSNPLLIFIYLLILCIKEKCFLSFIPLYQQVLVSVPGTNT